MQEMTFVLAWLIKDLKFYIDPNFELEIDLKGIVQGPKGGISDKVSIFEYEQYEKKSIHSFHFCAYL